MHNFVKKKKLGQIFSRRLGVLEKEGHRRMYLNLFFIGIQKRSLRVVNIKKNVQAFDSFEKYI